MYLAFGVDDLTAIGATLDDILEMQPPQGIVDKVTTLSKLGSIANALPKTVSRGACQEVVLTGDEIDLDLLPIQRCWPGDPARSSRFLP